MNGEHPWVRGGPRPCGYRGVEGGDWGGRRRDGGEMAAVSPRGRGEGLPAAAPHPRVRIHARGGGGGAKRGGGSGLCYRAPRGLCAVRGGGRSAVRGAAAFARSGPAGAVRRCPGAVRGSAIRGGPGAERCSPPLNAALPPPRRCPPTSGLRWTTKTPWIPSAKAMGTPTGSR